MKEENTKIAIDKDKKGVTWIRASPVNLVVSISDEKIYVWACEKGKNIGSNVFSMKIIKGKNGKWDLKYAKFKKEKT